MRMWMIDPKLLCNKHLLGEHAELHKFKPSFEKKHSISGRIRPVVQIEPLSMKVRHDQLAEELLRRGMKHHSNYENLPDLSYLPINEQCAIVDIKQSLNDLMDRCSECKKRMQEEFKQYEEELIY